MAEELRLRTSFDAAAVLYNAVRPRYPEALFDALVQTTGLPAGARLLEVGVGTGQATQPLARRGYDITGVELGENLARVARRELERFPNVEIVTGAFEAVDLPADSFDLVYAATAFHWITPAVRFAKPHRLLRTAGHLAVINTEHVSDEAGDAFFHATQPIHREHGGGAADDYRLPTIAELGPAAVDGALFEPTYFGAFPLVVTYRAEEYAQLLATYSPNLAMTPARRSAFLQAHADLITHQFGGAVEKHFAMTLTVARKRG